MPRSCQPIACWQTMIHVRIRTPDRQILKDAPPEQLGELAANSENLIWIDLDDPTEGEISLIASILNWTHFTIEDLISRDERAKIENFDGYTVLVMHDFTYRGTPKRLETPEVDFVIGSNYIASVHYHDIQHIIDARDVSEHLEAIVSRGTDYLLYVLIDHLVDGYFPVLDDLHEEVENLEQQIINDPRPEVLLRIFEMKRDAVALRRTVSPQLEVFSRLTSPGFGVVSDDHTIYFRDVHDHLIRIFEAMDTFRDLMSGALDAYLSTVSNRMNDVMKRLTILAALFLPITFFTGLMGMNLRTSPPWRDSLFWVFAGGMFAVSFSQYMYFKARRWI